MTDACGMWGLGRPEDEQATYRALLSIRNSCVTVAGIQVCGRAASQDLVSDFKAVSACCVLRRMRYAGGERDAPARALLSAGAVTRVACVDRDRERPTKQCYHTKQVTKNAAHSHRRTDNILYP
jgi:hypothetical protein